jgi:hypothetical protein
MARGKRCIAHTHDYLVPEEYHHLRPQCRGGETKPDNMVWLCANAHSDVHYFLDLIEKQAKAGKRHPERIPGPVADHFGPKVRAAARRGWALYADEFLTGRLDAHALLWDTSGQPSEEAGGNVPPYELATTRLEVEHWLSMARLRRTLNSDAIRSHELG